MATIEERIVSMKFNNSGFESGVRSTMGWLDKLKAALRLPGASTGIEEMNGAMGRFNFSPMQNGLMGIQNQFSVLQTVATGALLTIGHKVVELGSQLAGGLSVRPIMEGFQEYETKIGSIQTIYANTHEKYGTSYDDITNALDELNTYADQTIYNFGDMTRNIGLFTNAGLELGPSVSMIKGFSNAAAASGTDAQRAAGAAYQLSQGLSQGRITLMDWNSLVNAGMGNAVMKEGLVSIAHAMGTLDKSTMNTSEAIENQFRDSLQKGWLTSDVMSTYLQIMSGDMDDASMAAKGLSQEQIDGFKRQMEIGMEAATKTRTFTALMGTLAESVGSGWGQTFEILFGEFEEATRLWSGISDVLTGIVGKSTKARNDLLQSWSDLGGRAAVLDGLKNAFEGLFKIGETIGDTFRKVFTPIKPEQLVAASEAFKKFTEGLKPTPRLLSIIERALTGVFRFFKGILDLRGLAFETVFAFFDRLGKALSFFKTSDESVWSNPFVKMGDALGYVGTKISNFVDRMNPAEFFGKHKAFFTNLAMVIMSLGDIVGAIFRRITGFISAFSGAISDTFGGGNTSLLDTFMRIATKGLELLGRGLQHVVGWFEKTEVPIHRMRKNIGDFFERLRGGNGPLGDFLSALSNINPLEIFSNGISHLSDVTGALGKVFGAVFDALSKVFSVITSSFGGDGGIFSTIGSAIGNAFSLVVDKAGDFVKDLAEALSGKDFSGILDIANTAIFAGLAVMLKQFLGSGSLISQIKEAITGDADESAKESLFTKIKNMIIGDEDGEGIIDKASESINEALSPLTDTLETMQNTLKATTLMQIAFAVAALAGSVVLLAAVDSVALTKALTALTVMFGQLAGMLYIIQAMNIGKLGATLPLLALGLMGIATAVGMLVIPVMALSQLSWDELIRGLVGIAGIMATLATLGPQLSASSKGMIAAGIGLTILSVGIGMISASVLMLGKSDLPTLAKGLASVAVVLGALMLFEKFSKANAMGIGAGAGILLLSGGIVILAGALKIMSSMDIGDTVQSLFALAGALTVISVSMAMMPKNLPVTAAGMLLLSGAIMSLSGSLLLISTMSAGDSFQSLITLAAALGILAVGVNAMTGALAGAAALVIVTLALAGFIPILATLGSMPWQVLALGLGSIAAAFVLFAAAGYMLTPVVPTILGLAGAILALSLSITIIVGSITLVIASLALLAIGISQLANTGTQALTDLINIIPILFAALGEGIISMLATITNAGTKIVEFVVTIIQSVLTAIQTTLPQILETVRMAISGVLDLVITLTPQIVETVRVVLTNILQLVIDMMPQIVETVRVVLTNLLQMVIDMTPLIVDAFITVMQGILDSIVTLTPSVVDAVIAVCTGILNAISTLTPQVVQTGVDMVMALVNGIVNLIPQLVDAGMRLIIGILDGISRNIGQVITKGADVIVNFLQGIQQNIGRVADEGFKTVIAFIDGLSSAIRTNSGRLRESARSLGWEIINGLTGGLAERAGNALAKAAEVGSSVINKIKETMGINSPSKYTTEFGKFLVDGLVIGQERNLSHAERTADKLGTRTLGAINAAISSGIDDLSFEPVVTPVMDLSNVKKGFGDISRYSNVGMTTSGYANNYASSAATKPVEVSNVTNLNFTQNNTSPKSLNNIEIYRNTKNTLAMLKREVF